MSLSNEERQQINRIEGKLDVVVERTNWLQKRDEEQAGQIRRINGRVWAALITIATGAVGLLTVLAYAL